MLPTSATTGSGKSTTTTFSLHQYDSNNNLVSTLSLPTGKESNFHFLPIWENDTLRIFAIDKALNNIFYTKTGSGDWQTSHDNASTGTDKATDIAPILVGNTTYLATLFIDDFESVGLMNTSTYSVIGRSSNNNGLDAGMLHKVGAIASNGQLVEFINQGRARITRLPTVMKTQFVISQK